MKHGETALTKDWKLIKRSIHRIVLSLSEIFAYRSIITFNQYAEFLSMTLNNAVLECCSSGKLSRNNNSFSSTKIKPFVHPDSLKDVSCVRGKTPGEEILF